MSNWQDAIQLKEKVRALDTESETAKKTNNFAKVKDNEKIKAREFKAFTDRYSNSDIRKWIGANEFDQDTIIFTEFFGGYLALSNLTTSQIRNVFGEVKRMEMQSGFPNDKLLMLKARLAYNTKRNATEGSRAFQEKIEVAIDEIFAGEDQIEKNKRFEKFNLFFEAILAYHRAYGGK